MENFSKRLRLFAEAQCISVRQFEISIGLPNGTLKRQYKGMNSENIAKIANKYPDLDLRWLITGKRTAQIPIQEQKPINDTTTIQISENKADFSEEISRLWKLIESQQQTINILASQKGAFQSINI